MGDPSLPVTIFLLILSVGLFLVLSAIVIINRHVQYRNMKNSKSPYTPIGQGLPKNVRDSVEQTVDSTCTVFVEPKVFTEEYEQNWDDYREKGNVTFLYRLKVVDMYKGNEDLLNLLKNGSSHPEKDDLSQDAVDLISDITELYMAARHSYKPFTEQHFNRFSEKQQRLFKICGDSRVMAAAAAARTSGDATDSTARSSMVTVIQSGPRPVAATEQPADRPPTASRPTRRRSSDGSIDSMTALIDDAGTGANRPTVTDDAAGLLGTDESSHSIHDRLIRDPLKRRKTEEEEAILLEGPGPSVSFVNPGIQKKHPKAKTKV